MCYSDSRLNDAGRDGDDRRKGEVGRGGWRSPRAAETGLAPHGYAESGPARERVALVEGRG